MAKVSVLGAGSWGLGLSMLLNNNGHEVTVWSVLPEEINQLNTSPPLKELKNGLENISLNAFSDKKVELYKYYRAKNEPQKSDCFYLAIFQDRVIVYEWDGETVFMNTNIQADELPEQVRNELLQKKEVSSQKELYAFLESYSS